MASEEEVSCMVTFWRTY